MPCALLLWEEQAHSCCHWSIQIIIAVIMKAPAACQAPFQSKLLKHHGARKVSQTKWFKPAGITNSALPLCEIKQRRQGGWMLWTLTATLTRLKHNWYHSCCQFRGGEEKQWGFILACCWEGLNGECSWSVDQSVQWFGPEEYISTQWPGFVFDDDICISFLNLLMHWPLYQCQCRLTDFEAIGGNHWGDRGVGPPLSRERDMSPLKTFKVKKYKLNVYNNIPWTHFFN